MFCEKQHPMHTKPSGMADKSRFNGTLTKITVMQSKVKPLEKASSSIRKTNKSIIRAKGLDSYFSDKVKSSVNITKKAVVAVVSKTNINGNGRSICNTHNASCKTYLRHNFNNYSRLSRTSPAINESLDDPGNLQSERNNFCTQEKVKNHGLKHRSYFKRETYCGDGNDSSSVKAKKETNEIKGGSQDESRAQVKFEIPNLVWLTKTSGNISQSRFVCGEDATEKNDNQITMEDLDIAKGERDFLRRLSDPRLKTSLQNIIKKRKDKMKLSEVLTENSYKPLPQNTTSFQDLRSSDNVCLAIATENVSPIQKELGTDINDLQSQTNAPSMNKHIFSVHSVLKPSLSPRPHCRGRNVKGVSFQNSLKNNSDAHYQRPISGPSSASSSSRINRSQASSISARSAQQRKSEIETKETRIILPSSAKNFKPSFTRQKTKLLTVKSPEPLTKAVIKRRTTFSESEIVREFLIMYARLKSQKQIDGTAFKYKYEEPVQMISSIPELVIKSSIGQFITGSFHSKTFTDQILGLQKLSKHDKYEEAQRTKLLKIKTCMKHLASMV